MVRICINRHQRVRSLEESSAQAPIGHRNSAEVRCAARIIAAIDCCRSGCGRRTGPAHALLCTCHGVTGPARWSTRRRHTRPVPAQTGALRRACLPRHYRYARGLPGAADVGRRIGHRETGLLIRENCYTPVRKGIIRYFTGVLQFCNSGIGRVRSIA